MDKDKVSDGGSAFPLSRAHFNPDGKLLSSDWVSGMSLRDYFAAKTDSSGMCPHNQHEHEECSKWAFDRANAMLKAREAWNA